MPSDRDVCGVMGCGLTRREHEQSTKNHEFNADGNLIPRRRTVPPQQQAAIGTAVVTGMIIRLCHMLARKGVLTDDDVQYITGGSDAGSRGNPTDSSQSSTG